MFAIIILYFCYSFPKLCSFKPVSSFAKWSLKIAANKEATELWVLVIKFKVEQSPQ